MTFRKRLNTLQEIKLLKKVKTTEKDMHKNALDKREITSMLPHVSF